MNTKFKGKDFLTLMDFTKYEVEHIVDTAIEFKKKSYAGETHEYLRGSTIGLLFEKPSTRTRVSFLSAIAHLGGHPFSLNTQTMQLSRGEPIKDTARVLDRYLDGLVIRTFGQETVREYAEYMKIPVINALTDLTHPCQGLADLMTIWERKGKKKRIKLAYVGDVYNVCHSLMVISTLFDFQMYVAGPLGYRAKPEIIKYVSERGGKIVFTENIKAAFEEADIIYANTWHSMGGPEAEKEKRVKDFKEYQANIENSRHSKKDFIFMHCLPGYRGEEMTDEIIESAHSVVWDQAENRMHTEKAVISLLIT